MSQNENVMEEAQRLVHGDRQEAYGHPLDDFSRTARMWSVILNAVVTPQEVALCMIAVKISRECNRPKRDNLVDICGYAGTLEMVNDEMKRRSDAALNNLADAVTVRF